MGKHNGGCNDEVRRIVDKCWRIPFSAFGELIMEYDRKIPGLELSKPYLWPDRDKLVDKIIEYQEKYEK